MGNINFYDVKDVKKYVELKINDYNSLEEKKTFLDDILSIVIGLKNNPINNYGKKIPFTEIIKYLKNKKYKLNKKVIIKKDVIKSNSKSNSIKNAGIEKYQQLITYSANLMDNLEKVRNILSNIEPDFLIDKKEYLIKIYTELIFNKKEITKSINSLSDELKKEAYDKLNEINDTISCLRNKLSLVNKGIKKIQKKVLESPKIVYKQKQYKEKEDMLEDMIEGKTIIIQDPINYLKVLKKYLKSINVNSNYYNVLFYVDTFKNYTMSLSPLLQKECINLLINLLKSYKENNEVIDKIINDLSDIKYEEINLDNINIPNIDIDLLEKTLKKNKNLNSIDRELKINDINITLIVILEFYKNKLLTYSNKNSYSNNYLKNIPEIIISNLGRIEIEYLTLIKKEINSIKDIIYKKLNVNSVTQSNLMLINMYNEINQTINKLIKLEEKNGILHEDLDKQLRYIVNDIRSIELLSQFLMMNYQKLGYNTYEEILETYFNIILNSNNPNLIHYYQKVIQKLYNYSNDDIKNQMVIYMNEYVTKVLSKVTITNREDYVYRLKLFEHSMKLLQNKKYNINDLLKICVKKTKHFECKNNIFTIDADGTKIYENAYSVEFKNNKYIITLYTSDISDSILENIDINNKNNLLSFNNSLVEDKERKTIAFSIIVDKHMHVENINIYKASIVVDKNLYYKTFDEDYNSCSSKVRESISNFIKVGNILSESDRLSEINRVVTIFCNQTITDYFYNNGMPLIDRESIQAYIKFLEKNNDSMINIQQYINKLGQDGIIYNPCNYNFSTRKYCKVSSPLRENDALINQLLAWYYNNYHIDIEELALILDSICTNMGVITKEEVKQKNKINQLTNKINMVQCSQGDEKDKIYK